MLKTILTLIVGIWMPVAVAAAPSTFYDIPIKSIEGKPLNLAAYKGKVVLVVNTASRCGFTRQYEGLEALYAEFKDKGLVVLGAPSNDFNQEPGDEESIKAFCSATYKVSFPMTEKISVRKSPIHPLYGFLMESNPAIKSKVSWNFNKFIVNKKGVVVAYFGSTTSPSSDALRAKILEELK